MASRSCAAIEDPTTSSLRPCGAQHVFYRMFGVWAFRKRHPKRSTRGLANASALLLVLHVQPT